MKQKDDINVCPKCGLINPDNSMRCDCGYDFASGEMKDSYLRRTITISKKDYEKVQFLPMTGILLGLFIEGFSC